MIVLFAGNRCCPRLQAVLRHVQPRNRGILNIPNLLQKPGDSGSRKIIAKRKIQNPSFFNRDFPYKVQENNVLFRGFYKNITLRQVRLGMFRVVIAYKIFGWTISVC